MAVVLFEKIRSQLPNVSQDPAESTEELSFVAAGSEVEADIKFALAALPATWGGCALKSYTAEHIGAGFWNVSARYDKIPAKKDGDSDYNFDITGGTVHITQDIATTSATGPAGALTAGDFKGVIGQTADGAIAGCDIDSTHYAWSETWYFAKATVDATFVAKLKGCRGKVNNATWRGYAAGSVRVTQINGKPKDSDTVAITYHFEQNDNLTNVAVGDITVPAIKGFEYLDVIYRDVVQGTKILKQPKVALVHQVYNTATFTDLGIGT